MDVDHLHGAKLLEDGPRRESWSQIPQAPTQGDVQAISQKRNEDVGFDALFELMKDRADAQIALEVLEGFFDLDELDVESHSLPGSSSQRLERSR